MNSQVREWKESVLMGFSFCGRGISEAGEALGMFCTNRMRSSGSRGAEEQELLVQDVELDLTGTANTSSLHARQCLFPDSAGRIQWGVAFMRSCLSLLLLFHVTGGKTVLGREEVGKLGSQGMDRYLCSLKHFSEVFLQTGEQSWSIMGHMSWDLLDLWVFSCNSQKFSSIYHLRGQS